MQRVIKVSSLLIVIILIIPELLNFFFYILPLLLGLMYPVLMTKLFIFICQNLWILLSFIKFL